MRALAILAILLIFAGSAAAAETNSVWLEDLTSPELKARVAAGAVIALVPTGGTEQNGVHMPLGKHNFVVRRLAGEIAEELGNAIVAPVLPYVPEGAAEPPEGHMKFAGTLTLPEPVFEAVLESTARSLRAHGFRLICFLGDHGGSQPAQARVAHRLDRDWSGRGTRVLQLDAYYAEAEQRRVLRLAGLTDAAIGHHAGIPDTSELLAVAPDRVRPRPERASELVGSDGEPRLASAELGETMLRLKREGAVKQIRAILGATGH